MKLRDFDFVTSLQQLLQHYEGLVNANAGPRE
jgi:hypothetical protein